MPSAFPTQAQVQTFLQDAGVLSVALPASLASVAASAQQDWEMDVGCLPWIVSGTLPSTREYDAPDGYLLDLGTGAASIADVTVDTTILDTADWKALPGRSPSLGRPYNMIRFTYQIVCNPGELYVSGRWGYTLSGTVVPQDAFDAVLRWAACKCLPTILGLGGQGTVIGEKQGEVQYQYAQQDPGSTAIAVGGAAQWENEYRVAVARYSIRPRFA